MESELVEVVANNSSEGGAVQENQELRLHPRVEVHFHFWRLVTINSNMRELLELIGQVFVILFNLGNDGVPLGSEVEQGELGLLLVQVVDHVIQVLWHLHSHLYLLQRSFCRDK